MRLGFALFAGAAPEILRASAREAEGLGYSSFWVNHPGATDGLAALALAAGETRRIELGIGVIPLHTRGPDSIVQGVHANGLPLDRLLLGVGSPNPGALTRVREGVAALRSKLAARLVVAALGPQMCRVAGEVADARSEEHTSELQSHSDLVCRLLLEIVPSPPTYTPFPYTTLFRSGVHANGLPLDRLLLGVGSPNPGALTRVREGVAALRSKLAARLVVAALGPQMCRVAGEVADAVLFNWLTPEHARRSAEWVRAGAAAAGRQPPRLFAYVRVALGAAASDRLREEGVRYAAIPAYAAHFARMGVKPVETAIAASSAGGLAAALPNWQGAVDEIVLRAITGTDTIDENLALLRAIPRPAPGTPR